MRLPPCSYKSLFNLCALRYPEDQINFKYDRLLLAQLASLFSAAVLYNFGWGMRESKVCVNQ
jgi:hypothetical protein